MVEGEAVNGGDKVRELLQWLWCGHCAEDECGLDWSCGTDVEEVDDAADSAVVGVQVEGVRGCQWRRERKKQGKKEV